MLFTRNNSFVSSLIVDKTRLTNVFMYVNTFKM